MKESLNSYISQRQDYLDLVTNLLSDKIPQDDATLIKDRLTTVIAHRATISTMLAKLEKFLDEALAHYKPVKDKGDTDLDRKINLDNLVSDFRYWRNLVEGVLDTIDSQVSVMQSLLSFEKKHLTQIGSAE